MESSPSRGKARRLAVGSPAFGVTDACSCVEASAPQRSALDRAIRLWLGLVLAGLPLTASQAARAGPSPAVDAPNGRPEGAETEAFVAALRARLLAAPSATLVLEAWCAEHGFAADPHLVALRLAVPDKPLTAAQRARLAIGPDEPVRYRRVRLACGDRVLSEADNWYVPARLTPAMNATLDGTRTPFGRVVRPLAPSRRTIEVRPRTARAEHGPDDPLFEIDALLTTGAGEPFCEVAETYLGGALPANSR